MTPYAKTLVERMRRHGCGERLIARVLRLNPDPEPRSALRGVHYASTVGRNRLLRDEVSKGEVIRRCGRDVWERIPRGYIRKDGKRAYIARSAFEDNVWLERRA